MPVTVERYEQSVSAPPLCEQLRIRDLLEDVAVQSMGRWWLAMRLEAFNRITRAMREGIA